MCVCVCVCVCVLCRCERVCVCVCVCRGVDVGAYVQIVLKLDEIVRRWMDDNNCCVLEFPPVQ